MSLLLARDARGKVTHAKDAEKSTHYKCAYCDAGVYIKVSSLGNPFYACYPGEEHKDPVCRFLTQHTAHVISEPADFFSALLSSKKASKTDAKPSLLSIADSDKPSDFAISSPDLKTDENEGITRPLTSLMQVWKEGLNRVLKPDDLIGQQRARDVFIFQRWFIPCFVDTVFEGGLRVIQARPDRFLLKEQKIQFVCFWKSDSKGDWNKVLFQLEFANKNEFFEQLHSLFEKTVAKSGASEWSRKFDWALIAGDWTKNKISSKTFDTFQSNFVSKRQIYGCPSDSR